MHWCVGQSGLNQNRNPSHPLVDWLELVCEDVEAVRPRHACLVLSPVVTACMLVLEFPSGMLQRLK